MNERWKQTVRLLGVLTVCCGLPAGVARSVEPDGQGPKSIDTPVVRDLLTLASTRRIDVVCLGDSNQLYSGFGWQDGWTFVLGEQFPMYATPLLGAGDNNGVGIALNAMAGASFPPLGAPPELLAFNNPDLGVDVTPYGYLPAGMTITAGSDLGVRLIYSDASWSKNHFNADHALRFHFDYGTFDSAPGAVFQPQVVQPSGPNPLHPPISTSTGIFEIVSSFIDLPAAARTLNDLRFRWFGSNVPDGVGPVYALHMRIEDLEQTTGQSVSTLYGVGGATARDCAVALMNSPESQLRLFFERIRELQPSPKKILIRISFGANDFTENNFSVGPNGPFPPATDESVADNTREIMQQINDVWTLAGWDPDELVFLLIGPHARLEPEPVVYGFRQAIADVALDASNISYVNHFRLATRPDMLVNSWYEFPTGAHLSELGYESICELELATLQRSIPSDLNGDCVIDTADLGLLLSSFGSAGPNGDLNNDGIVDTADLGLLLSDFGVSCNDF